MGPVTYLALLTACCEELEVAAVDVAKIRKLPNVLVRKDRDVQRMRDGQELEVVLTQRAAHERWAREKGESTPSSAVSPPATFPTTSMLTVNPFAASNATVLALSNHGVIQPRNEGMISLKSDENGTVNHLPGLTSDSSEVHNHTHSSGTVNGLQ